MGNAIEYECQRQWQDCRYWEATHGIKGFNYKDERFKNCGRCTRPMRTRFEGKGIYNMGKLKEGIHGNR